MKVFLVFLTVAVLAACASSGKDAWGLIEQGRCREAADLINLVDASNPGRKFYNLGIVAGKCDGDEKKALNFMKYSARLGYDNAIRMLIEVGENVPDPDLKERKNPSISCRSYGNGIGVTTYCD